MTRVALVAFSLAALPVARAAGSDDRVTVAASPETIELCPGEARRVQVVVRNDGSKDIFRVRVSAFTTDAGRARLAVPDADLAALGIPKLEKGSSRLGTVTVTVAKDGFASVAAVHFTVRYALAEDESAGESVAIGKLDVKRPAALGAEALKADVRVAFGPLYENETGNLLLVLTNGTTAPLQVKRVTAATWDEKTTLVAIGELPKELPPQQAIAVPYTITMPAQVVPGKHVARFDVEAEALATCGTVLRQFPTFETSVAVRGESELLKLLDVSSLLFLPGFLVLATAMLLWKFPALRLRVFGSSDFPLALKSAEFWLVGITLSLGLAFAAPDFVIRSRAYAFDDIRRLWAFSIAVGAVGYLVALGVDRVGARIVRALRELELGDPPMAVLKKAARRRWKLYPVQGVTRKGSSPAVNGFRLWDVDASTCWVIPLLECTRNESDLDGAVATWEDARKVVDELQKCVERGECTLSWKPWADGAADGPRTFASSDLEPVQAARLIDVKDK